MKIAVTGTPATGKTSISKKLAKELGYKYVDLNNIIKKRKLYEGYDKKEKTYDVDIKQLKKISLPADTVVDGHLSHFMKVDMILLLRVAPQALKKRMQKKGWSAKKIEDNIIAESIDMIKSECLLRNVPVVEVRSDKKVSMKHIARLVKKRKSRFLKINWLSKNH